MAIYWNNNTRLTTLALTDENSDPITAGTVTAAVFTDDRATELIAAAQMTHQNGGVWIRDLNAITDIQANIPAGTRRVWTRVQVGSPVTAEFWRMEQVDYRETS